MAANIVQTDHAATFVGAGPVNMELLEIALTIAPFLVAVDGGAEMVRNYGRTPDLLIGDMDSVSAQTLRSFGGQMIDKSDDQETTDFEKVLAAVDTPLAIGVGFIGGRADHQMAAMNALGRHKGRVILLGPDDVVFRVPEHLTLELEIGTRISLHPLAHARVDSKGLRWPIHDLAMSANGVISQSNEAASPRVELWATGNLLGFLPAQALAVVAEALMRSRQMT